jgi:hypothetical protein
VFDLVEDVLGDMVQEQWGREIFRLAVINGYVPVLERLLAHAQPETELRDELLNKSTAGHQSVGEAVLGGHVDVLRLLLAERDIETHLRHINYRGENVLHIASTACDPDVFRYLARIQGRRGSHRQPKRLGLSAHRPEPCKFMAPVHVSKDHPGGV